MSTASDILRAAADRIERRGWVQGRAMDKDTGATCLMGAIGVVSTAFMQRPDYWEAAKSISPLLADHLGEAAHHDVVAWNDAPGRTKDEVVRVLRDVADLESLDELPVSAPEPVRAS